MMKIRVLLFAGLRERVGAAEIVLEDFEPGAKVCDVLSRLHDRWPVVAKYAPAVALNCEMTDSDAEVRDGDEIALLPPVSGG